MTFCVRCNDSCFTPEGDICPCVHVPRDLREDLVFQGLSDGHAVAVTEDGTLIEVDWRG